MSSYTIAAESDDPNFVVVTGPDGQWRIHRECADPEHRLLAYRLAAGWFANLPAGYRPDE